MATCYSRYRRPQYYYCSNWDRYGRWIFLGVIVLFALFVFFLGSCISARRRRKMGHKPYAFTAWTLGKQNNNGQANYNPNMQNQQQQQPYYNNSNNPAPTYNNNTPQYNNTPGSANDYYGNRNDVEVQQPGATYGGYNSGQPQYAPPAGKPPGH